MTLAKCIEEVELITGSTNRESPHFIKNVERVFNKTPLANRLDGNRFTLTLGNEGIIIVAKSKV